MKIQSPLQEFSSLILRFGLLALIASLQACAGLPPRSVLPIETVQKDSQNSALGRLSLVSPSPELSGFRLLPHSSFALDARLALAQAAENTIDVQYYIFRCDAVGKHVLSSLESAADRGVKVRLLVDDFHIGDDDSCFATFAQIPNVQVRIFNPLPARDGSLLSRLLRSLPDLKRINHRMHNKLFIADNSASVSGGRNIGREYFMQNEEANFIDMDVLAVGPVVREQSISFDQYWNSEYSFPVELLATPSPLASIPLDQAQELETMNSPLQAVDALGRGALSQELPVGHLNLIWAPAQVIADSPDKISRPDMAERFSGSVTEQTLEMMTRAQNRVIAISPYFIPSPLVLETMRETSRRGVHTTVLTNSFGATDEALVHFAYARYRKEVLALGVDIYELGPDIARRLKSVGNFGRSQGRLHAKMLIVDDTQLFVGSMNMDERSASLNTEVGLVIDSAPLARDFRRLMDGEHFYGAYRLQLNPAGRIQWIDRDDDDRETLLDTEPDVPILRRFKRWLLTPLIPEDLL